MSFKTPLIAATALLTTALAQNTTTTSAPSLTLPLYGFESGAQFAASVIAAARNATTLYLNCVEAPSDPLACIGVEFSRTLITGPSTYHLQVSEVDLQSTQDCVSSTAAGYAVCEEYASASETYNYQGVATYPAEVIVTFTIPITAGAAKLDQAEATGRSGTESAVRTGQGDMTTSAPTATSGMTATMTGEAASETSAGAAVTEGTGREMEILAAACVMGSFWL